MFSKHLSMLDLPLPILPSTLTTNGFVLVSCSMTFADLKENPKIFRQNTFGQSYNCDVLSNSLSQDRKSNSSILNFSVKTPLVNNASFSWIKFTFTLYFLLCWKYEIRGPSLVGHNIQVSSCYFGRVQICARLRGPQSKVRAAFTADCLPARARTAGNEWAAHHMFSRKNQNSQFSRSVDWSTQQSVLFVSKK